VRLRHDAASRAISGLSSGGICAFTAAWERPDAFGKVLSWVGSFTDIRGGHVYPSLIRKTPRKPIRVFLQDGKNDLDVPAGDWWLANLTMASALDFAGYDYATAWGKRLPQQPARARDPAGLAALAVARARRVTDA
jgi:enterochelin esterase family protein